MLAVGGLPSNPESDSPHFPDEGDRLGEVKRSPKVEEGEEKGRKPVAVSIRDT